MKQTQKRPRSLPQRAIRTVACLLASLSAVTLTLAAAAERELPDRFFYSPDSGFSLSSPLLSSRPTARQTSESGSTDCEVLLFHAVPVKTVTVTARERKNVTVSGQPFGIKLYSDGVMIVGLTELETNQGACSPGYEAGLRKGDIITSVNGHRITENGQVSARLAEADGKTVKIGFTRGGKPYTATLSPVKTNGSWKAGLWVRDSVAGIGTLTYFDERGQVFAGLGHGITDADSGGVYPLFSGSAVLADVVSVKKGEVGLPGELKGVFTETTVGDLFANTDEGVFGTPAKLLPRAGVNTPVAFRQEIETGKAEVRCDVGEGVKEYEVEIEKIRLKDNAPTRNMIIRVTDERLLSRTGGIVQGMSGSPILQNGRLIGAVTHVFVNDPTRGYAIFAENMLDAAESILENAA